MQVERIFNGIGIIRITHTNWEKASTGDELATRDVAENWVLGEFSKKLMKYREQLLYNIENYTPVYIPAERP